MECPNGYTLSLSARAPEHTTPGLIDYELSAISSARYVQAYKHHRRINGRSNVRLPDSPGHHPNENLRRSSRTETTQMEVERRTVKHFIEMSWGNKTNFSLWCTIYDRGNNTPKLRIQQKQNWPNVFLIPWTNLPSSRINLLLFLTLFSFRDPSSCPCRKMRSGRWSAQARNVGSQCWLSILDRWSIEAWMIITGLYWLVILAPKSLPTIGRESLPELSRRSFKFIKILIMTIKFKT